MDESGKRVSFEEAIATAEAYGEFGGMPYEILRAMHANLSKDRPDGISVTQLLGCARKVFLDGKVEYALEPHENYATFRGSIIHKFLEEFSDKEMGAEVRVEREYRGVVLSGQPDSVRIISPNGGRKVIRDWKSVKELPRFDSAYTHHKQQINLYRWLLGLDPRLTDLEIVYFSMDGIKVLPLKRGGTNRYGRAIPNEVWDDAEVEKFLDDRLMIINAQRTHDQPIRYETVEEEHLWECNYCPVKQECYRRAAEEAEASWSAGETVTRMPPREQEKKKGKK